MDRERAQRRCISRIRRDLVTSVPDFADGTSRRDEAEAVILINGDGRSFPRGSGDVIARQNERKSERNLGI